MSQQLDLFASATPLILIEKPVLLTRRLGLMARRDALNERFGRGTVRVAAVPAPNHPAPVGRSSRLPWEGKAQWRSPAFTPRLEDLLLVNLGNIRRFLSLILP